MFKSKLKVLRISLFNEDQEYSPGSYIEGNVFLELSKEMIPVKSIKLQFSGTARVRYKQRVPDSRDSVVLKNSEEIRGFTCTIWRNEGSCQQQAASVGLSVGQYEFPFKIQIPADLALITSFKDAHTGSFIRYSMIAGISRSQEEELEHTSNAVAITIKDIVDVNVPHLMQPKYKVNGYRHAWSHGSTLVSVTLNKQGYCPEEYVAFNHRQRNRGG